MKIAVDADIQSLTKTGVEYLQRYQLEAVAALDDVQLVLYSRRRLEWALTRKPNVTAVQGGSLLPSGVWRRTWLRKQVGRRGEQVFYSPVAAVPGRLKVPVFCTCHELEFTDYAARTFDRASKNNKALVRSFEHGARFVCISENTSRDLAAFLGGDPPRVVVHPAPGRHVTEATPEPLPGVEPGAFLLFVSSLRQKKNVSWVVESFAAVADAHPELKLVLCGTLWEEQLASLGEHPLARAGRVVLPGYTSEPRLAWAYRNAVALLFPSEYEGFGIPVVEAMSMGLPVVTTRRGSIPEVAGEAALFVDPRERASLHEAIDRLLGDADLRAELIAKGTQRARVFSWEEAARTLRAAWRDLPSG